MSFSMDLLRFQAEIHAEKHTTADILALISRDSWQVGMFLVVRRRMARIFLTFLS